MTRIAAWIASGLALAAGAVFLVSSPQSGPTLSLVSAAHAQSVEIDTSTVQEMTLGDPDAPVEVIEYASYTCPHCARFHEDQFKQLKEEYIDTGKVHFIYREVYFDRYGLWASMIARCEPAKFFGITDIIYDKQSEWTRAGEPTAIVDALRRIARSAGMDNDTLEACLQDNVKAQTLVAWYQENADADRVQATPTILVDGRSLPNSSYADLKARIDDALGG
jgi:protein-disulfide isomerase